MKKSFPFRSCGDLVEISPPPLQKLHLGEAGSWSAPRCMLGIDTDQGQALNCTHSRRSENFSKPVRPCSFLSGVTVPRAKRAAVGFPINLLRCRHGFMAIIEMTQPFLAFYFVKPLTRPGAIVNLVISVLLSVVVDVINTWT
ncbi:MAG: hypothetical protein ISN29_08055 [Gammaproteobacteria bacterium AqS3]|nr:hypothetical protein [Gammaproteobacteria bacterium AqS3]